MRWIDMIRDYRRKTSELLFLVDTMAHQDPRDEEPYGLTFKIMNLERAIKDVQEELNSIEKHTTPLPPRK